MMREHTVNIIHKDKPVLLDKVLQDIQQTLEAKLSWLDYAFGKAHKITQYDNDGRRSVYPAAYNGKGEYISLLPNDNFGNFSWFDIYDPQELDTQIHTRPQITFEGALIFWYDLRSIYADNSVLYTEEVKDEILSVLTTPGLLTTNSTFKVKQIFERPENIYKDLLGIDKQFFMYPYAGLRIEFSLTTKELCRHYTK